MALVTKAVKTAVSTRYNPFLRVVLSLVITPAANTEMGIKVATVCVELEIPSQNLVPPCVRFSMRLSSIRWSKLYFWAWTAGLKTEKHTAVSSMLLIINRLNAGFEVLQALANNQGVRFSIRF